MIQMVTFLLPTGEKARLSSRFLDSSWTSASCCRHLWNESADVKCFSEREREVWTRWHSMLNPSWYPHPISQCLCKSWLLTELLSNVGKQHIMAQMLRFLTPTWANWMKVLAPDFNLAHPRWCRHFGSEPTDRNIRMYLLSLSLSPFQINQSIFKRKKKSNKPVMRIRINRYPNPNSDPLPTTLTKSSFDKCPGWEESWEGLPAYTLLVHCLLGNKGKYMNNSLWLAKTKGILVHLHTVNKRLAIANPIPETFQWQKKNVPGRHGLKKDMLVRGNNTGKGSEVSAELQVCWSPGESR